MISRLFEEELPVSIDEKRSLLLTHNIAIWDVVQSCKIKGSDDFTIQDVMPNDIKTILNKSKITKIYGNGGKAYDLYVKYCFEKTKVEMTKLPSTSPANAAFSLDKLLQIWNKELNC